MDDGSRPSRSWRSANRAAGGAAGYRRCAARAAAGGECRKRARRAGRAACRAVDIDVVLGGAYQFLKTVATFVTDILIQWQGRLPVGCDCDSMAMMRAGGGRLHAIWRFAMFLKLELARREFRRFLACGSVAYPIKMTFSGGEATEKSHQEWSFGNRRTTAETAFGGLAARPTALLGVVLRRSKHEPLAIGRA